MSDPMTGPVADPAGLNANPPERPPRSQIGVVGWLRANLFSSWFNTVLTLLAVYVIVRAVPPLVDWLFVNATFSGDSRQACAGKGGACWTFIKMRLSQFIYGFYPEGERWRPDVAFALAAAGLLALARPGRHRLWLSLCLLFVYPVIAFFLLVGGSFGLEPVETARWGGLLLTLVVAVTGIVASFPIGVLLALARRSDMPVLRSCAVIFIEVVRGVPLISVLFMASVMLPLFLPEGVNFDKLLRALIGVTLFEAAYIAEAVRGGLQALPKGQYEGAKALGLNYWKMTGLVVLPQALKMTIPGVVNSFISLFKDTTLVAIIGLFDLLGIIHAAAKDTAWLGFDTEGYVFAALIFWIFCFTMSRISISIEKKLDTGHRR